MKAIKNQILLALLLLTFSSSISFGQSFEGKLTYIVAFEIETQNFGGIEITKEQILEKTKADGEFFDTITITIKNGNYLKEDNALLNKKIIYKADENKVYTIEKDFEYVIISDANEISQVKLVEFQEPIFERFFKVDSKFLSVFISNFSHPLILFCFLSFLIINACEL